jgi:phage terminase large subunit-like protein
MLSDQVSKEEVQWYLAIEISTLQDSFYFFVKRAWHIVEPSTPYVDGKHIKLICDELEACFYGKQTKLAINVPPGFMKSLLTCVFFPAWVWTKAPHKRFMCISFAQKLAERDSRKCRDLVTSSWYQQRFNVRLSHDQQEKVNFENTDKGFRKAYGMTSITGEHADFILVDDPINIEEAESEAIREAANYVMDSVLPSRVNDPATTVFILIMQRLNEDDPTGHILEQGGWEHLCLPMDYEGQRFVSKLGFKDWRTEIGELLWKERFPEEVVAPLRVNRRTYAGQYQQRPSPLEGNVFKKEWFRTRYPQQDIRGIYLSVDGAFSTTEGSAKSAILVAGYTAEQRLIPLFAWADKVEFPQFVDKIIEVAKKYLYNLYGIVIESKASGISAMQTIKQTTELAIAEKVYPFNPPAKLTKEERAILASKWCENGSVILPEMTDENKEWLIPFEEEIFNFPSGRYKDLTDCLVQIIFMCEPELSDGYLYGQGRK